MLLPGGLGGVIGQEEEGRLPEPITNIFPGTCTSFPRGQILSVPLSTIHSLSVCPLLSQDNLFQVGLSPIILLEKA